MSVSGNYAGGVERPKPTRLTTTSATVCVTGYDRSSTVAAVCLANETGSAVAVNCYFNDGSTDFLVFAGAVPASGILLIESIPLRLYNGDTFKVAAGTANAITATPIIIRSHPNEPADRAGNGNRG